MESIQETIDVEVPVRTAYNQWTQFEEFPQFMEGVESVRQIDDTHLHWSLEIGGVKREFDAEVTEQVPDQRVAWRSTDGTGHGGVVTFHHLAEGKSRVALQVDWAPSDLLEKVADLLGIVKRRTQGDLRRFKEMIESRGAESGAWRGTVEQSTS